VLADRRHVRGATISRKRISRQAQPFVRLRLSRFASRQSTKNRRLNLGEFCRTIGQTVYPLRAPGPYYSSARPRRVRRAGDPPARTGWSDPQVVVKPTKGQIANLIHRRYSKRTERDEPGWLSPTLNQEEMARR